MSDEAIENALAKLVDAVRPFIDEYLRDDDARNILAILTPTRGNWITDTELASPWGQPAKATVRPISRRTITYWQ